MSEDDHGGTFKMFAIVGAVIGVEIWIISSGYGWIVGLAPLVIGGLAIFLGYESLDGE